MKGNREGIGRRGRWREKVGLGRVRDYRSLAGTRECDGLGLAGVVYGSFMGQIHTPLITSAFFMHWK